MLPPKLSYKDPSNPRRGKFDHGTSTVVECDKQFHSFRLLLTAPIAPGDDGGRGQVLSTVDRPASNFVYSTMGDWA